MSPVTPRRTGGAPPEGGDLRTLTLDGARLRYVEAGAGEPVVLLHGYPQSHLAWRHQVAPLARTHRVVAVDWLGWGQSERPLDAPLDYDAEVARLGRLLDALDMPAANLLAHDYGGFLALGLTLRAPSRVLRLAVLNSRAHASFPPLHRALTALVSLAARAPGLGALLALLPWGWIHRLGLRLYARRGCFDAVTRERYVGWLDALAGRRFWVRFFAAYRTAPRDDLRAGLGGVRCPAAVVWGTRDPWCPPRIGRELAEATGAELTLLEGAGHFVMEERPDAVTAALRALLARPLRSW